ncbi:hypothetical protein EC991_009739 [Linnemannia zychae]|nr:hypothetical protein EC991_009739 [Linnemannia zychae]
MFQDQLDALKQEQYTITPENLIRLRDRLQHYFMWVKSEMAPANNTAPIVQAAGSGTSLAQPIALGVAPSQSTAAGTLTGANATMAMGVSSVAGPTPTATLPNMLSDPVSNTINHVASSSVTPLPTQVAPGMVVKLGLTPADLKLPPPKKTNNSPPNTSFPGSPRSDAGTPSTPNIGLTRPGTAINSHGSTPKPSKAVLSAPLTSHAEQQNTVQDSASPTPSKVTDGSNVPSSQILLKTRQIQQQQAQIQQQQQGSQQVQDTQMVAQQQSQQPILQLPVQPTTPQQHAPPLPSSANSPAKQAGVPLESLSKEELIRQYQVFKGALSGAPLPAKQAVMVKMQLQRIQGELAKPHRQEQAPRLGDGVSSSNVASGNPAITGPPPISSVSHTNAQLSTVQAPVQPIAVDLGPQILELQLQENKTGPSQPMEPLDFLTFSYKSLARVNEVGLVQDGTTPSSLVLRNAFEGFVGKRVGNGPGKDMYDEGTQKRRKVNMTDADLLNSMLLSSDSQPDAFMASYGDWAQQIATI